MPRVKASGRSDFRAECETCGWTLDSRNALAVAAKHCDKYHHNVFVDCFNSVHYKWIENPETATKTEEPRG